MDPEEGRLRERNAYMESLSIEARDRFLSTLEECAARGMTEEEAWREAAEAAQTTYAPEARDL
jgi:hypothetical protein